MGRSVFFNVFRSVFFSGAGGGGGRGGKKTRPRKLMPPVRAPGRVYFISVLRPPFTVQERHITCPQAPSVRWKALGGVCGGRGRKGVDHISRPSVVTISSVCIHRRVIFPQRQCLTVRLFSWFAKYVLCSFPLGRRIRTSFRNISNVSWVYIFFLRQVGFPSSRSLCLVEVVAVTFGDVHREKGSEREREMTVP